MSDPDLAPRSIGCTDWTAALAEVYLEERVRLIHIAYRFVQDWDDAEDIVQDVFIRVGRSPDVNNAPKYLRRAVGHAAVSRLRKRRVHAAWAAMQGHAPTDFPRDFELLQTTELAIHVKDAIDHLPKRSRMIAQMHWVEGNTCREVAATLGVSIKTVENQCTRA